MHRHQNRLGGYRRSFEKESFVMEKGMMMEGTPRLLDVFDVKVSLDKEGKSWNCIRLDGHLFSGDDGGLEAMAGF